MPLFSRIAVVAVVSATMVGGLLGTASAQAGPPPNVPAVSLALGFAAAALDPAGSPPGVNVACQPSAEHPYPVVLVNGSLSVMHDSFDYLGPQLAAAGYCVYGYNYGGNPASPVQSCGPLDDGVTALATEISSVLSATHAAKVDLVGFSQGGVITELYTKFGGAPFVHSVTALAPSTHGTTAFGLFTLAAQIPGGLDLIRSGCPAAADLAAGSAVITKLDTGPIAAPGIAYTVLETRTEDAVTPIGSAFIDEPGVRNIWLQDVYPLDISEHLQIPFDWVTAGLVLQALAR